MVGTNNEIQMFLHCRNCSDDRPETVSPQEWVRLEAGFTRIGLQVRCSRCDLNIVNIDFEGHTHPANTSGGEPTRRQ